MAGKFIVNLEAVIATNVETTVLYLSNPIPNARQMGGILLVGNSLDTGVNTTFRVYIDPTVTNNGTPVGITSTTFGDGNTSLMAAYSSPVVTSKGTKISTFSVPASQADLCNTVGWYLPPGHSFLITAHVSNNNKGLSVNASWSE
jgi:hypothetical protein